MENEELDPSICSSCLYLVSAFLAMEPINYLISLARESGGGSITEEVQSFIWENCISKAVGKGDAHSDSYVKSFLKKVIADVESSCNVVLDEFYEQYAYYMISLRDDCLAKGRTRVCKSISFLFPNGCSQVSSCPKVVIPLQCSLNMLEGDTGCSIWPSSLFLSEFILSYPEIFFNRSCFEVGSGVGLVGISLAHVKACKVILSDGDLPTLANMKLNLELNQLSRENEMLERSLDPKLVECKYLPWESTTEKELEEFKPDILLGADVIYDPKCLPHLIRMLVILLNPKKSYHQQRKDDCCGSSPKSNSIYNAVHTVNDELNLDQKRTSNKYGFDTSNTDDLHGFDYDGISNIKSHCYAKKKGPVAYIASVIRNADTFDYFLRLAVQAYLSVVDITEAQKPFNLLPYMHSYDRSSIRLFIISFICD